MAQAGMTRWRASNSSTEGNSDEVQKSLELLDKVLSEFDDLENGNIEESGGEDIERSQSAPLTTTTTPELESPSLGHTSEDDGYMSMNGRRNKFMLNFRTVPDEPPDFPPPPEEAQRIISNLLPRVSPCNTARKVLNQNSNNNNSHRLFSNHESLDRKTTTSTQTTLPKTRHQRPYGWENGVALPPLRIDEGEPVKKFGSLPGDGLNQYRVEKIPHQPQSWLPPRTNPCVVEKHHEVRRMVPDIEAPRCVTDDEHATFSDDSLEDVQLPTTKSKRHSIAWEVPLEDCLTPGSTKVVGRRRRRSTTDHSSTGSISRISQNLEEWPDPPEPLVDDCDDEDGDLSVLSTELPSDLNSSGTYVIRRGRKKERRNIPSLILKNSNKNQNFKLSPMSQYDMKRYSSTFDNIKSLLKDGKIDGLDETPPDFPPPTPPGGGYGMMTRGTSLPSLMTSSPSQHHHQHHNILLNPHLHHNGSLLNKHPDFISSSLENIMDSEYDYKDNSSLENMLIDKLRQSNDNDDEFDSLDSRINESELEINQHHNILPSETLVKKCESHTTSTTDLNLKFSSTDDIDISDEIIKTVPAEKCDIAIQVDPTILINEPINEKSKEIAIQVNKNDETLQTDTHTSLSCQTEHNENNNEIIQTINETINSELIDSIDESMVYSSESFVDKEDPKYLKSVNEIIEKNDLRQITNEIKTTSNDLSNSVPNREKLPTPPNFSPEFEKLPIKDYPINNIEFERIPTPDYPNDLPPRVLSPDYPNYNNREKIPTPDYPKEKLPIKDYPNHSKSNRKSDHVASPDYPKEKLPIKDYPNRKSDHVVSPDYPKEKLPIKDYPNRKSDHVASPDYPKEKLPIKDYPNRKSDHVSSPDYHQNGGIGFAEKIPTPDYSKDEIDTISKIPPVELSRKKCSKDRGNLNLHLSLEKDVEEPVWTSVAEFNNKNKSVHIKEIKTSCNAVVKDIAPQPPPVNGCQVNEGFSSFKPKSGPGAPPPTSKSGDFNVKVEIVTHEFGPLPPSPVEEDDEFIDTVQPCRSKSGSVPCEPYVNISDTQHGGPHSSSSLKTRSMDAGFSRNYRNQQILSRKDIPPERRTLPTDLPGPSRRRAFQKRGSQSPRDESRMQVSCSLPETPIFARGCDIPRTPHRRAPEVPTISRTAPRAGAPVAYINRPAGMGHGSAIGLEQAMVGAELLRMQGPGRGWYPRHRQPRPASVEHLDRLSHTGGVNPVPTSGPWGTRDSRKPLTLPPNLTPKFFHKGPRDALRRVTSLLIRGKGSNTNTNTVPKENCSSKKDGMLTSSVIGPHGLPGDNLAEPRPKRGFFRSFWKRSRHYSLEHQ